MRKNSLRFRLAYSSPILEENMYEELDPSGEENLSQDILNSQEELYTRLEVQKIFKLFHHSQYKTILIYIITNQ